VGGLIVEEREEGAVFRRVGLASTGVRGKSSGEGRRGRKLGEEVPVRGSKEREMPFYQVLGGGLFLGLSGEGERIGLGLQVLAARAMAGEIKLNSVV